MNLFSVLTSKIFAGVSIILLIVSGYLYWQLDNANGTIEDQRTVIADRNATIRTQNASITKAGQDREQERQAFTAALAAGNITIREAQQRRVQIVRGAVRNNCPTPQAIMGAGL